MVRQRVRLRSHGPTDQTKRFPRSAVCQVRQRQRQREQEIHSGYKKSLGKRNGNSGRAAGGG